MGTYIFFDLFIKIGKNIIKTWAGYRKLVGIAI